MNGGNGRRLGKVRLYERQLSPVSRFGRSQALLAELNVILTPRQMKRAADLDAHCKRKLPFFLDPIEGRLKIERNSLLSAYFNRQVEAERNCDL
jgi:hypothetical protein